MEYYPIPWHMVNIDVSNAIRKDFDLDNILVKAREEVDRPGYLWKYSNNTIGDLFNVVWLDYMKGIGLEIQYGSIFYRDPHYIHPTAHTDLADGASGNLGVSFNWCLRPSDADMTWYKIPPGGGEVYITPANTPALDWPLDQVEEIARKQINNECTLVRIDIPHNVIMRSLPRWCVTARTKQKFAPGDWAGVLNFARPFIIG
jgi:hypothetical protein